MDIANGDFKVVPSVRDCLIEYSCHDGYTLYGDALLTCTLTRSNRGQLNYRWLPGKPSCSGKGVVKIRKVYHCKLQIFACD